MSTIDDIIGTAKLPETTVRLCPRGDLAAEHNALSAQLAALGEFTPSSLADTDPRAPIAASLVDLEERMRDLEVPFTFRALGRRKYRELMGQHPGEPPLRFGPGFIPALIAACALDPEMTPTDVERLFDVLSEGDCELLFLAAYQVNEGVTRVPFSAAASALTRRPGTKS